MMSYRGKISYLLPVLFLPGIFSVLALSDGELLRTPEFFISFWHCFVAISFNHFFKINLGFC